MPVTLLPAFEAATFGYDDWQFSCCRDRRAIDGWTSESVNIISGRDISEATASANGDVIVARGEYDVVAIIIGRDA